MKCFWFDRLINEIVLAFVLSLNGTIIRKLQFRIRFPTDGQFISLFPWIILVLNKIMNDEILYCYKLKKNNNKKNKIKLWIIKYAVDDRLVKIIRLKKFPSQMFEGANRKSTLMIHENKEMQRVDPGSISVCETFSQELSQEFLFPFHIFCQILLNFCICNLFKSYNVTTV